MILPIFYATYLADPILADGAISASWLLLVTTAIIAFIMARFLNQIGKLSDNVVLIQKEQALMKLSQDHMKKEVDNISVKVDKIDPNKIAEHVLAKLYILNGGGEWPFKNKDL